MKAIAILVILLCAISTYAISDEELQNKIVKKHIHALLNLLQRQSEGSNATQESCDYRCNDGECISGDWVCNSWTDCSAGEEEDNCGPCALYEFQCDSGRCLHEFFKCDGFEDCHDGSDENKNCSTESLGTCAQDEFQCGSGYCIFGNWECDNHEDCLDGGDEHEDCEESDSDTGKCSQDQFQCGSGFCIDGNWECDDFEDCLDGSDEHEDCEESSSNTGKCSQDKFQCGSGYCISGDWECDNYDDCLDGSDEHEDCEDLSSSTGKCSQDQFQCGSGYCISGYWECDNFEDCLDGSDEHEDCEDSSSNTGRTCNETEFTCGDGGCIPHELRCDGWYDCIDGADETVCVPCDDYNPCVYGECAQTDKDPKYVCKCSSEEGKVMGYNCDMILQEALCKNDQCNFKAKMQIRQEVSQNYATRTANRAAKDQRLKKKQLEDGTCDDNDEFACDIGDCIPSIQMCDDNSDCANGEDEVDCGSVEVHVSLQVKNDEETNAILEIFPKRFQADAHVRLESNIPDVSRTNFKLDMGMSHFQAIFAVNIVKRSKNKKSLTTACFNLSLKEILNLSFIPNEVPDFDGEIGAGSEPVNLSGQKEDIEPCFMICNDDTIISCDTTNKPHKNSLVSLLGHFIGKNGTRNKN